MEFVAEEEFQQAKAEQPASTVREEELASDGEVCELHVYESRREEVVLRAGTKKKFMLPKRKSHRASLILNESPLRA